MERIPVGAPVLTIKKQWLDKILSGEKTVEVRGATVRFLRAGDTVYFAESGSQPACVVGKAKFSAVDGPVSADEFVASKRLHCVRSHELPYPRTFFWHFSDAERLCVPVQRVRKRGCVVWSRFEPVSATT